MSKLTYFSSSDRRDGSGYPAFGDVARRFSGKLNDRIREPLAGLAFCLGLHAVDRPRRVLAKVCLARPFFSQTQGFLRLQRHLL